MEPGGELRGWEFRAVGSGQSGARGLGIGYRGKSILNAIVLATPKRKQIPPRAETIVVMTTRKTDRDLVVMTTRKTDGDLVVMTA